MQVTGASMFLGFFPPWILEFALKQAAIIVSPNYLKLPESTGLDIMNNVSHFWTWLHDNLDSVVASTTDGKVEVDRTKKLVMGQSAGEYRCLISKLSPL